MHVRVPRRARQSRDNRECEHRIPDAHHIPIQQFGAVHATAIDLDRTIAPQTRQRTTTASTQHPFRWRAFARDDNDGAVDRATADRSGKHLLFVLGAREKQMLSDGRRAAGCALAILRSGCEGARDFHRARYGGHPSCPTFGIVHRQQPDAIFFSIFSTAAMYHAPDCVISH